MKKRTFYLAAVLMLSLSLLCGCAMPELSSNKKDQRSEQKDKSDLSQVKVGICIYQFSDNFMSQFSEEIYKYLLSLGFSSNNLIMCDATNNKEVQLTQVQQLIESNVDALIINPVNASTVHAMTELAANADVPVIYINREPDAVEEGRWEDYNLDVTYVGCDARQSGIYQAELLISLGKETIDINKDGKIQYFLIKGAPENIDAKYRSEYSVSTLEQNGWDLDCRHEGVGNWDRLTAKQLVTKALVDSPDVELIICNNDAMAIGAVEALIETDKKPGEDVFVVGVDALPQALNMVIDGSLAGTVFNDYITQSHSAADAVVRYLKGETNEHYIGCDYIKVNKGNAQSVVDLINMK
jgi:methyl-galactoside transport system substrate-binding protein